MYDIPGFRVLATLQVTHDNVLLQAEREGDAWPVTLKTPRGGHPGPRERERYRQEYRLLERLRGSPGVQQAFGLEVVQGRPVLVLETIEGQALSEVLEEGPLEVERCLLLGLRLADTLSEVHRRGVIHKDVKPGNVLVGPRGAVWLIDFGIATLQQVEHPEASPGSEVQGTLAYLSPEQTGRMNRTLDYRTDFYSLGVTLYEALTGQRPFQGRDTLEWFHAHLAQEPRPPDEVRPGVAPQVSALVLKLLAKGASERYQSAEGLRADVARCLEGLRHGQLEAFALGERDVPARFVLPTRLYGRQEEVDSLLEAFQRVAGTGRPEVLLVSGYSGIGKSALVNELHRPVLERRSFFLSGKCDQFQRDRPYATLAQSFEGLVQQWLATSDEELAGWRRKLLAVFEDQGQLLVELVPRLEAVVGPQPAVPELPPTEARRRLQRLCLCFVGVVATRQCPLVLFLDDLQWADMASLEWLRHLATHPDTPPVLLVGAYRDNEVSASHPLRHTLEALRQTGARLSEVKLAPLSPEQTRQLVADALPGAEPHLTEPLSGLAYEKTAGNPFFLLQLLQTLYRDGLVGRAPQGGWQWSEEGVRARGYSDNVVDFLVERLRLLPTSTQRLLMHAACVGNVFALRTLGSVTDSPAQALEHSLEAALEEGLVVRVDEGHYRFLHDRIQQAAYALIPEDERKSVHLRIGRLWLASLRPEELKERLFEVVNQLNAGAEGMDDLAEREHLARLNAEAGWKARASAAFGAAGTYLEAAFRLLPGDPWQTHLALAFQIRLAQAICEWMNGNVAQARLWVDELLPHARTHSELEQAYRLKGDLISMASGNARAALACLLEGLERLGMPIPAHPSQAEVMAALAEVSALINGRPIESLAGLPTMVDPAMTSVMGLLGHLDSIAFFTDENLFVLDICRMVSLSLRHGNTAASVQGYVLYGFILVALFKKYREGEAFGRLAYELMETRGHVSYRPRYYFWSSRVSIWNKHLSVALELARSGLHHALLSGDSAVVGYCCINVSLGRFGLGHDLTEVFHETAAGVELLRKVGFMGPTGYIQALQDHVQQLRGLTRSFDSTSWGRPGEEPFEVMLAKVPAEIMRCLHWIVRLQSRFMCGDYEEARKAGEQARSKLWFTSGQVQQFDYYLYQALALAGCCREGSAPEREEWLESLRQHQRQLAEWADNCPDNFRAAERMVTAELASLQGRGDEAWAAYDEAIRAAREYGFIQHVALASELAARHWKQRRADTIAPAYARQAYEAYRQWGAEGKARQLKQEWPQLGTGGATATEISTQGTSSRQIDALTVVKAQQAISGQMVLEKLSRTLLQVAMEHAGAQRGALLLEEGEKLSVVDSSSAQPGEVPWTLVSYVRRTKEAVRIGDATLPHAYATDSYFQRSRARSVLALPLLRHEQLQGVLYLENELAPDAFTPGSLVLLGHIATQAAISMENTRLYTEVRQAEAALREANEVLEARVEERTRQLQEAQARLVETARSVGMAEIASNVLHNVGNVLTSVVVETQLLRQAAKDSRLARVGQVAALLEGNEDRLAAFLSEERGRRVPGYLSELAVELSEEQVRLQEGLSALEGHVEHIRAVVLAQQGHAKKMLLEEECDLARLVEDALRIELAALPVGAVTVRKELAALPPLRVDKHRVLQILVNLLSNALRAVREVEDRRLEVRLEADGRRVRLQVLDNGMGFLPEVRAKLFSHGFTTWPDGHGFGLHASALAAMQLGGTLRLESDGPGRGATATLELPCSMP